MFFQTVVVKKTLESPLDSEEIKRKSIPNIHWIDDGEAKAPVLWPPIQRVDSLERPQCLESLKAKGEGDSRG